MTFEETIQFVNNPSLDMENETWKQHPIYTKYYASNLGRIKYLDRYDHEVIKKQGVDKRQKRFRMTLWSENVQINYRCSRFICECFYGMNDDLQVDHINTIQYDNRIENLRFCTAKENCNNPITVKKVGKDGGLQCKITQMDVDGNTIRIWNGFSEIEKELKYNKRCIYDNCVGRTKIAYGFKWEYYKEPDLEGEIWKEHPTLNIQVSNKGRIKKTKKNGLTYIPELKKHSSGYVKVQIKDKNYNVHRLVAELFIPNPDNKDIVCHIDGDTTNNTIENLKWTTMSEIMTPSEN